MIFEKLDVMVSRFDEINKKLMNPKVFSNNSEYRKLMKELKELTPVVDVYKSYKLAKAEFDEANQILADDLADDELRSAAKLQLGESECKIKDLELELKKLLLPKDEDDDRNVIVEIRGGAGGEEAALFCASLHRMYCMFAEKNGWKVELLGCSETEIGGFKEISFEVSGKGAYSRFKFESGVHRVQRVPETETQGRVHTSTVTVAVLPEVEDVEFEINPSDVETDTFRASGAGGQHVNKTESAIRLTHVPTGLVVECQDERSQFKNREKAMKILRTKLYERARSEAEQKVANERRIQVGTGDRSERIRTYNFPQGRVTDHRIGLTLYKLNQILDGELDEVVNALITADQAAKLSGFDEGGG